MADSAFTHSSDKFYISTTPQNTDLDDNASTGFPSLTYVEVKAVGSVGEHGLTTNIVSYDTWDRDVSLKAKGITDAGSPDVECARIPTDPGQVAMTAAGQPAVKDSYAFKIELQDGTVRYMRGLVAGPRHPSGRNEDFDLNVYTLGLQQPVIDVAP